jgi:SAM-dependent methyltransferase
MGLNPGMDYFAGSHYQAHNRARLAHLSSLGLSLSDRRVLELGAGPGDHTGFYLARGCEVVSIDARQECLDQLNQKFPQVKVVCCDLNTPDDLTQLGTFDIIHCYGILYHLQTPTNLLEYMSAVCRGLAIIETCVSPGDELRLDIVDENDGDYTQSLTGTGCRPTRPWLFAELERLFPFVYLPRTQPAHPEFPINWNDLTGLPALIRAVFVASQELLDLPSLSSTLLKQQERWVAPSRA